MANNQYHVNFGALYVQEGFGFTQNGTVIVENDYIIFQGKKSWNLLSKIIIVVLISVSLLTPLVIIFNISSNSAFSYFIVLIIFMIVNYFCVLPTQTLSIPKESISQVKRKGKEIRFKARHPQTGKFKKTFFTVNTKENALMLEDILMKSEL